MYLHERENWWQFTYDSSKVLKLLGRIRVKQGMVLGSLSTLGFEFQDEAMLSTMSVELVRSSEIEGEMLNLQEVRSSIARRLGIETAGPDRTVTIYDEEMPQAVREQWGVKRFIIRLPRQKKYPKK